MLIYTIYSILKLGIPLDLYKTINGKRIIGEGRSLASFCGYIFIALLIGIIIKKPLESLYLGIGAVLGTYFSSFIKRRLGLKRGQYAFFIDQTDFIIFGTLMYMTNFEMELKIFLFGIGITLLLHHLINLFRKNWENIIKMSTQK